MRYAFVALTALTIAVPLRATYAEEKSPAPCSARGGALYCSGIKNVVRAVSVTGPTLAHSCETTGEYRVTGPISGDELVTLLQKVAGVSSYGVLWVMGNAEWAAVFLSDRCGDSTPAAAHLLQFHRTPTGWSVVYAPRK
jgi:hypothetical protein